jgi:hypothetical protein
MGRGDRGEDNGKRFNTEGMEVRRRARRVWWQEDESEERSLVGAEDAPLSG